MMPKKIKQFEDMARDMVGDGKSPNLYFVSQYNAKTGGDGAIVGVVRSLEAAKGVAGLYDNAVLIEDRQTGVVWENAASERFQREAAEAEEAEYADNPRGENPNQGDVISAWAEGKKSKASALRTDGVNLYSYDLLIGTREGDRWVVYDYTGPNKISVTTSKHVGLAKAIADEVRTPPERSGRWGNPGVNKLKSRLLR